MRFSFIADGTAWQEFVSRLLTADSEELRSRCKGFEPISSDRLGDYGLDGLDCGFGTSRTGTVFQMSFPLWEPGEPLHVRVNRKLTETCGKLSQNVDSIRAVMGVEIKRLVLIIPEDQDVKVRAHKAKLEAKTGLKIEIWGRTKIAKLLGKHPNAVRDLLPFPAAAREFAGPTEGAQAAVFEENAKRTAERRWQYIQSHPIRYVEVLLILKGAVGFEWLCRLLEDTRLSFAREEPSCSLGQLLAVSSPPNTEEPPPSVEQPVCSFWEVYDREPGYWVKAIRPEPREFLTVAGFDVVAPWSALGVQNVATLQDLSALNHISIGLPPRAYQVGVEEFQITFRGDTFSFSVQLSEHGLDFVHEMARSYAEHAAVTEGEPAPVGAIGRHFSGVELLELFLSQLLPHKETGPESRGGITGLSGPDGKAISFYPTMPEGFAKSSESDEYSFRITVPKADFAGRIEKLEVALKADPTNARSYGELAALYEHTGRLQDAIQCLETAFEKAPPIVETRGLMAEILAKVGRFPEALGHLQQAVELSPDNAKVQNGLGACLGQLGDHDAALVHFRAATRIEPSNAGYQCNLGKTLAILERYDEALSAFRRAVDLAPDDPESAMMLGILLDKEGRSEDAARFLEKATQLAPDHAEAHQHLGTHLAASGKHEQALRSLQRAIEIGKTARRYELLGGSFAALERWSDAETAFRRGLELNPSDPDMLANLGATVAYLGRFAEAAELLEQCLRINPHSESARQNLARLRQLLADA